MNARQYKKLILLYLSVLTAILSSITWLLIDKPFDTSYKNLLFVNSQQEQIAQFERNTDSLLHTLADQFIHNTNHTLHSFHSLLFQEEIDVFTDKKLLFGNEQRYVDLIRVDFQGTKSKIIRTEKGSLFVRKHSIYDKGTEFIFTKSSPFPFGQIQAQLNDTDGLALYNTENILLGYLSPLGYPYSSILFINSASFYLLLISFLLLSAWIIPSSITLYRTNQVFRLVMYVSGWCIALKIVDLAFAYRYPMYPHFLTSPFLEGSSWLNPTYLSRITSMVCLTLWLSIISLKSHRTEAYKQLTRISGTNQQILSITLLLVGFLASQFITEELKIIYRIFGISSQFSNLFREDLHYITLLISIHLVGILYFLFLHPLFVLFNAINKNKIQAYLAMATSSLCWFLILSFSQIENQTSLLLLIAWAIQYTFNLPQGFYSIRHKTSFYTITIIYLFSLFATISSYYFDKDKAEICQNEIKEVILTSPSKKLLHDLFSLQKRLQADASPLLVNQDDNIRNAYVQSIQRDILPEKIYIDSYLTDDWSHIIKNNFTNSSYNGIYKDKQSQKMAILVPKENKWLIVEFQEPLLNISQLGIGSALNTSQKLTLFEQKVSIAFIQLPTFKVVESYGENIRINRDFKLKSLETTANSSSFVCDTKRIYQHQLGKNALLVFQFPTYTWVDFWGNFAFISLASFLLISLYFLLFSGVGYARTRKVTSLTTKIVLYIQASYLIPLLITILFVVRFFDRELKRNQKESYLQQIERIQNQIEPTMRDWYEGKRTDSSFVAFLSDIQVKPLHTVLIKNKQGGIIYTSSKEGSLGNLFIEKTTWDTTTDSLLIFEGRSQRTMPVTGTMKPIRSVLGDKIGSFVIYFSDASIQYANRITEIIQSILLVFLIIFNGLFLISFFISKKLINPIKDVAIRLKNTTLSELTEKERIPLVKHDEIGLLVDAYNGMIKKMEESKDAIAEAEKQTAWQEIAKQVAHEIKNPLTPMKLSIQQLQRTLAKNPGQATPEVMQSLALLIDQIDDISTIASSFSSYAQMPIPKKVRMNLTEVVQKSIQFILSSEQIPISFESIREDIWVLQDPSFMDRLLKNILLNAIQSIPKGRKPNLHVGIQKRMKSAVVSITDNGSGIPESLKDKVFLPHFSTKKIGSGIGLAIAKKGVESMGGNIWFESQEGVGTTFYVEVPLQGAIM